MLTCTDDFMQGIEATWVQQAAADIIQLSATSEKSSLVTMVQGTSRGSDCSMAVTSTYRAKTGILPLAAATLEEEKALMLCIYQKLCKNVGIPVPEDLPAAFCDEDQSPAWQLLGMVRGNFRLLAMLLELMGGGAPGVYSSWSPGAAL